MSVDKKKKLTSEQKTNLLEILKNRFDLNPHRHLAISWAKVQNKLEAQEENLWSLYQMEITGGEPDVVGFDKKSGAFLFFDCSPETPKGRKSICYDAEALASRKEHKPKHSAVGMAEEMGITLLSETQYRDLQELQPCDTKTSSWLLTPKSIRILGGAIFGDNRFGNVFIYHNGAESYYAGRGFRGVLSV